MDGQDRFRESSKNRNWIIIIKADVPEGEEGTWMTRIEERELHDLLPLLEEIKRNEGYFPSPVFRVEPDPKPEILYSHFPGWSSLISRLPTPKTGIRRILEVHFFPSEDVKSLYM